MPKKDTQFRQLGVGSRNKQPPISVLFPANVDEILRSLPKRSEFVRNAVIKEMIEQGMLNNETVA